MMLHSQKRIAASVLKCSPKRVWINPTSLEAVKEAITKADIRKLINNDVIIEVNKTGVSKGRSRFAHAQKKKGRRRGYGSRKGKATARSNQKEIWMNTIRAQRRLIQTLKEKSLITQVAYKDLYYKAKGGFFRSIRHLKLYITEHTLVKK